MSYTMEDVDRAQELVKRKSLVKLTTSPDPLGYVVGMFINYHLEHVGVVVEFIDDNLRGMVSTFPHTDIEVIKK